ncbi:MAG: hypothetical protein BMS9Abin36_1162 [Gammaproteobacteria bacterium]|nr:MAG: hypothetical protein BMS9Abin36_1162 [Gammaproteobacteria bacterium]
MQIIAPQVSAVSESKLIKRYKCDDFSTFSNHNAGHVLITHSTEYGFLQQIVDAFVLDTLPLNQENYNSSYGFEY